MSKKQEEWIHLAQEYVVSFFPNMGLVNSITNGVKVSTGRNLKFLAQKYENNSCRYLIKKSDWEATSRPFAEKLLADPSKFKVIEKNLVKSLNDLLKYSYEVNKKSLSKLSNRKLFNLYNNFLIKNKFVYDWGLALPLLDYQETTYISDALSNYLKNELTEEDFTEYFTTLTTTPKRTAGREEEINLLKIISKINKYKKILNLFKNNSEDEIISELPKINKRIFNVLLSHTKKYSYTTYVYEGPSMEITDFVIMVKEFLSQGKNSDHKIKQILKSEKDLVKKQKTYLNKIKPSPYYKKMIKLSQDVSFLKFWRREQQSHCYCLLDSLIKEMAKRLDISPKQFRFMLPEEVEQSLVSNKKVEEAKINQRIKLSILVRENGSKVKLLTGKETLKVTNNFTEEKIDYTLKELKGQTACPGKVKGKVTIVNTPDDIANMKEGDILVSFATNPNLMPAIRKASAIITDEGGLTCHAAIVSRELNIPCVVGLKIITKLVKNNDLVEVDATKGIIKIL